MTKNDSDILPEKERKLIFKDLDMENDTIEPMYVWQDQNEERILKVSELTSVASQATEYLLMPGMFLTERGGFSRSMALMGLLHRMRNFFAL